MITIKYEKEFVVMYGPRYYEVIGTVKSINNTKLDKLKILLDHHERRVTRG